MTSEKNGRSFTHWKCKQKWINVMKYHQLLFGWSSLPPSQWQNPSNVNGSCVLLYWEMLKSRMYICTDQQTGLWQIRLFFVMGTFTFSVLVLCCTQLWCLDRSSSSRQNNVSNTLCTPEGFCKWGKWECSVELETAVSLGESEVSAGRWVTASTFWVVQALYGFHLCDLAALIYTVVLSLAVCCILNHLWFRGRGKRSMNKIWAANLVWVCGLFLMLKKNCGFGSHHKATTMFCH